MQVGWISIKVHGATSVNITVEGHTFSHQFIFADRITAEAILGMDFPERNECILDLCKRRLTMKDLGAVQLQPHSLKKLGTPVKINLVGIPATAEIEVMARLHSEGDTHVWMIENASTVPIMVARALVKPSVELFCCVS